MSDAGDPIIEEPTTESYRVDSYHINIGTGDAAVHVLVATLSNGDEVAEKTVWIDSGYGHQDIQPNFLHALNTIPARYPNLNGSIQFDAIIITHWDGDHHGGFSNLLRDDPDTMYEFFRDTNPDTDSDTDSNADLGTPTMIYCSDVLPKPYINGKTTLGPPEKQAQVHWGVGIMGTDVFGTNVGLDGWETMESITDVLEVLHNDDNRPHLLIVTVDEHVIGPGPEHEYGSEDAVWDDDSTVTNRASIGTLIVWPSTQRISHYFAGDLHYRHECALAEWLEKTADIQGRIPSIKASHHGSASSTPPMLLRVFKPINIIISAGRRHNHPGKDI
jgi:hypothetical protein